MLHACVPHFLLDGSAYFSYVIVCMKEHAVHTGSCTVILNNFIARACHKGSSEQQVCREQVAAALNLFLKHMILFVLASCLLFL
jgi:hypothetical protein